MRSRGVIFLSTVAVLGGGKDWSCTGKSATSRVSPGPQNVWLDGRICANSWERPEGRPAARSLQSNFKTVVVSIWLHLQATISFIAHPHRNEHDLRRPVCRRQGEGVGVGARGRYCSFELDDSNELLDLDHRPAGSSVS